MTTRPAAGTPGNPHRPRRIYAVSARGHKRLVGMVTDSGLQLTPNGSPIQPVLDDGRRNRRADRLTVTARLDRKLRRARGGDA